jgi:hypothetical protein
MPAPPPPPPIVHTSAYVGIRRHTSAYPKLPRSSSATTFKSSFFQKDTAGQASVGVASLPGASACKHCLE